MKFSPFTFSNQKSGSLLTNKWFPYICLTITILWLITVAFLNEIPPDSGDGIMHFFISEASWENPILLLDHWGKPLFILLSSPFAQFGFHGIIFFQILTYLGTCLIGFKILNQLNCSSFILAFLPVLLILTNDYAATILSALTEPLFNLFIVSSLWLFINKKWLLFTILLSFTPYLRSEGQLCIVLGLTILILFKQYKFIPFLFLGFIIYSIIGLISLDDFWWYFTKSPYDLSNNIYGKGTWYHYLISYKNYLGNHGLVLFVVSTFVLIFKYKDFSKIEYLGIFFSFSIFVGILASHSYFWATGQNGSIGLTRITTQGLPLLLISCLFILSHIKLNNNKIQLFIIQALTIIGLLFFLLKSKTWPIKATELDLNLINTARYLKKNTKKNQIVFYHHPLLAFKMETNPFKKNQQLKFHFGHHIDEQVNSTIKKGDILVWDSHFGPVEAGMPFHEVQNNKKLTKIKQFITSDEVGIHIYQHQDTNIVHSIKHDTLVSNMAINCKAKEFYDILTISPKEEKAILQITIDNFASNCDIICTDRDTKHYQSSVLKKGTNKLHFEIKEYTFYQVYLWSAEKKDIKIKISETLMISDIFPSIKFYPNNTLEP